jgi:uncharacterized delta-60 repeat protein
MFKANFFLLFAILTISAFAQVTQEWVALYDGPENAYESAKAVTVDNFGNVYVTGESYSSSSNINYATVKYNSAGVQQWAAIYNGPGNNEDHAVSIAIDTTGNVYVTGYSYGSGTYMDYATVKYNSSGIEQWVTRYNSGQSILDDRAVAIALDAEGNVYVSGNSIGNGTGFDYTTIKYNSSGAELWVRRYNRTGSSFNTEQATSMTVDAVGNVYVTGKSNFSSNYYDYATIKYNTTGDQQWVAIYHAPGNLNYSGIATAITLDDAGNVYVTGESQFSSYNNDYVTIKYTSSGTEQWVAIYNGPENNADYAKSIAVDISGNVYVTGYSYESPDYDYATIKYNSSGTQQWASRYNGPNNSSDIAVSLSLDAIGNVYVAGTSRGNGVGNNANDYAAIKYNSSGIEQWAVRYNGVGNLSDMAASIVLDAENNVYVTGESFTSSTNRDFATIKYSQSQGLDITSPLAGEKWIAGETDTIRWTGGHPGQLLSLDYSTDNGQTFFDIDFAVQADTGLYVWSVPQSLLTTKAKIKITDIADTNIFALSNTFKIKGYVLTKYFSNGNYDPYSEFQDQYVFANHPDALWPEDWYQRFNYAGTDQFTGLGYLEGGIITSQYFLSSTNSDFPDWVSWVRTFGTAACYHRMSFPPSYSPSGVLKWTMQKDAWGGSCFGMSTSNALLFKNDSLFDTRYPSFPDSDPINILPNDTVRTVINELFTHQFGKEHLDYRYSIGLLKTPNETLRDIKKMLISDNEPVRTLSILSNDPNDPGGHSILAYKVEQDTNISNIFYVFVYDNSYPQLVGNSKIVVDTLANNGKGTWAPAYAWFNWAGTQWFYLRDPATNYLTTPSLPNKMTPESPFILDENDLQILNTRNASILITDQQGNHSGFYNAVLLHEIPNSFPNIIENGSPGPPIGYDLPNANYSIKMNNFTDSSATLGIFNGNKSFVFQRDNAQITETDRFFFDGGISYSNPDAVSKSVNLITVVNQTTEEKAYALNNVLMLQNDSIKLEYPDEEKLKLASFGTPKSYELSIELAKSDGAGSFKNNNISLSANTSHTIVADWLNFSTSDVIILIDEGNNGTVDDTLEVANQLTQTTTIQLAVSVNNGWNMVSIPGLHPVDENVNTWWSAKDPSANVFKYSTGYQAVTTAAPGEGYWMKHIGANVYNTGDEWPAGGIQIVAHNSLNGQAGWNLIGGYEDTVSTAGLTTNPSGLISGPVFKYSSGYSVATTLDPGYGYWVKLTGAGQINIPASLSKTGEVMEYFREEWGKIIITDNAGRSYTLYAVNDDVDLNQYELPPSPPLGMFDIRFGSGRVAEVLSNAMQTIELNGIEYPLTVRAENIDILLKDESGIQLNANLKSGKEITISNKQINKLMVSGKFVPGKYALEQNFPNPFNPTTTIQFSLPKSGAVTLKIYNLLGEEVKTLIDEYKEIGNHSVQFNANNLASGMYLYRFQAGSFVETKKMILIK